MANTRQAKKRARQAETHRQRNTGQRAAFRTALKKAIAAVEGGDAEAARAAYQSAVPIIDEAVQSGLIHRNKAARHKSRLNSRVKSLAS